LNGRSLRFVTDHPTLIHLQLDKQRRHMMCLMHELSSHKLAKKIENSQDRKCCLTQQLAQVLAMALAGARQWSHQRNFLVALVLV
jgi:hypothetical protein